MIVLVIIVVVFVIGLIMAANRVNSGASAWVGLGDVRGKRLEEIVAAVGPPTSISAAGEGRLYQWIKTTSVGGYHVALLFDDRGVCLGITHESRT